MQIPNFTTDEALQLYEGSCQQLAEAFVRKYFRIKNWKNYAIYWIGDQVGGVLAINDYFFDTNQMADFIRYKYTIKKMFEYMDYRDEFYTGEDLYDKPINIKAYKYVRDKK